MIDELVSYNREFVKKNLKQVKAPLSSRYQDTVASERESLRWDSV